MGENGARPRAFKYTLVNDGRERMDGVHDCGHEVPCNATDFGKQSTCTFVRASHPWFKTDDGVAFLAKLGWTPDC
jgi:hypothetical protein